MKALQNLSIAKKFTAGFAVVVAVVVAMCVTVFLSVSAIGEAVTRNDVTVARLNTASAVLAALVERQNAVRAFVASGDSSFEKRIADNGVLAEETMTRLEALAPDAKAALDPVRVEMLAVSRQEELQVKTSRDPARRAEVAAGLASTGRLTKVRETMKVFTDAQAVELAGMAKAQTDTQTLARTILIAGGVLATLLSIAMGSILSAAIARPIGAMTDAMRRLAGGDNTVSIPAVGRKDEVGQMTDAVETFKKAAIEQVRLEEEASAQRAAADQSRRETEAQRAASAAEQAAVVTGLATGLEKLAGGGLTYRIRDTFPSAYEKLRSDFNLAMERLEETMCEVAANATGVRSGSGEISQASDDLSRRTEQQAASLEETAAALDQITATVRKTASGASEARDAVGAARSDAERSGIVVRDAVAAMGEIEASAQQISQIIGVIDEIAFQTNLLALNAGVEAARAGDAGRGFAVVASEVRALAQRSAEAAKEIKTLISASSQQVERGVSLVGETGKVLDGILVQVVQISGVITEIAASAQEQATGLQQVNTAVNQMDQVTQQNAAMVEEATAASHALSTEAETLSRLISRFDLGKTPSSPPAHRPPPGPVAQLKTVGRGGAAIA